MSYIKLPGTWLDILSNQCFIKNVLNLYFNCGVWLTASLVLDKLWQTNYRYDKMVFDGAGQSKGLEIWRIEVKNIETSDKCVKLVE